MKRYGLKEVFATLQGEGANSGRPAVFLRFSGCNLGYEICPWCDTDWVKPSYLINLAQLMELVEAAADRFENRTALLAVVTGGEPSLQFDMPLAAALRKADFQVAIETNGSRRIETSLVDWITVSPKQRDYVQKSGDELKLVFTGRTAPGITPDVRSVQDIASGTQFSHYYLQPVDVPAAGGPNHSETVEAVMALGFPWRLGVQTHKVVGIR